MNFTASLVSPNSDWANHSFRGNTPNFDWANHSSRGITPNFDWANHSFRGNTPNFDWANHSSRGITPNSDWANHSSRGITTNFCNVYYSKAASGINTLLDMFHQNVSCTIQGENIIGSYNLLLNLTNQGICRYDYANISYTSQIISNNSMLINTTGIFRGIGFWNQATDYIRFTESFIIEYDGLSWVIKNYTIKTIS